MSMDTMNGILVIACWVAGIVVGYDLSPARRS